MVWPRILAISLSGTRCLARMRQPSRPRLQPQVRHSRNNSRRRNGSNSSRDKATTRSNRLAQLRLSPGEKLRLTTVMAAPVQDMSSEAPI